MVTAEPEVEGEVARLLDLIRGFQQVIADILYRQGVEPFTQPDDAFDPRRQRALSTVPTDDQVRNKRVAARLRKGFQAGEKVIRPEMVTVYSPCGNSQPSVAIIAKNSNVDGAPSCQRGKKPALARHAPATPRQPCSCSPARQQRARRSPYFFFTFASDARARR